MPIAPDFSSVCERDWYIHFTYCHPGGTLRYTDLCNILQLTAGFHAEQGGIAFHDMQASQQAWVLSRMRVEIDAMPKWRDTITVRTWIESLENSRSVRAMEVWSNEKKIIGCETFWAVINTELRRPEPLALPHGHFEKYGGRYATEVRVRKVEMRDQEVVGERRVLLSDLDIVDHANNVKYLEWCLDCMEPATVLENRITALDMNFMRELVLGDTVEISRNAGTFSILKDGKPCFALDVTF